VSIRPDDFEFFRGWLRTRSAISLDAGKEYLVDARLTGVAIQAGMKSAGDVLRRLRDRPPHDLEIKVVEALTTNETSFFRDWRPFEALRSRVIPELVSARGAEHRVDIWSAACSSGQEAYSLAMMLSDHFPALASWQVKIHCTDLSSEMVARTRTGRFTQLEVNRGLPAPLLVKHFRQEGNDWIVNDALRAWVSAQQLNLAGPWPPMPTMDVVLMRNVLIYFDLATRAAVLDRVRRLLRPGAALFLGSAETTAGIHDGFKRDEAGGTVFFRAA
jgi:chemotaxis protein methyltransferase CheR